MKNNVVISKATIDRLPLYFRTLRQIQGEGVEIISSEELGRRIDITPEQIRKDLASFGEFGKKGVGYYVKNLIRNIGEILGLHRNWNISLVGAGHLGWALANYSIFPSLGFNLVAIFDSDPDKVGRAVNGIIVQHTDELAETVKEKRIHIGILTVPAEFAQKTANKMIDAGITGLWNFAPVKLEVPSGVILISEDLSVGLSSLSYFLSRQIKEF